MTPAEVFGVVDRLGGVDIEDASGGGVRLIVLPRLLLSLLRDLGTGPHVSGARVEIISEEILGLVLPAVSADAWAAWEQAGRPAVPPPRRGTDAVGVDSIVRVLEAWRHVLGPDVIISVTITGDGVVEIETNSYRAAETLVYFAGDREGIRVYSPPRSRPRKTRTRFARPDVV